VTDKLVFKLSEKYYGIDTAFVYGIIESDEIYFLPGGSGFVKGVISLRGQLVTVVDNAVLSGQPDAERQKPGKIIVIQLEGQFFGIDISTQEVFIIWDKKEGSRGDREDTLKDGVRRAMSPDEIEDVPCKTILQLAKKILTPGRRKVLIADDMIFYRDAIKDALTSGGFEIVAEATNGQEAIELTKKLQPEIVILDIVMPIKNGLEAAEAIMALPRAPRVVICSSLSDKNIIKNAKELGADAYITKPFTKTEALGIVLDIA